MKWWDHLRNLFKKTKPSRGKTKKEFSQFYRQVSGLLEKANETRLPPFIRLNAEQTSFAINNDLFSKYLHQGTRILLTPPISGMLYTHGFSLNDLAAQDVAVIPPEPTSDTANVIPFRRK